MAFLPLFFNDPNLLYSLWEVVPLPTIFIPIILLPELFRAHPCVVTWVTRIQDPGVMVICIILYKCCGILSGHRCIWLSQRLLEMQILCHRLQQQHYCHNHHPNHLHLCFKDRGPKKTRKVPQVIPLHSLKAETQTEICAIRTARLFLYVKLLPQDLFPQLL